MIPKNSVTEAFKDEPRYAEFFTACKYKPQLYFEFLAHSQVFMVLEEGPTTPQILNRVKRIIRGKVANNSSLAKKYHKDETQWTFENWIEAYRTLAAKPT